MEMQVIYFILGIILGLAVGVYGYESSNEKAMKHGEKFVSKNLKTALDKSTEIICRRIIELKRDLTESEKDEIIRECYNRTNKVEEN